MRHTLSSPTGAKAPSLQEPKRRLVLAKAGGTKSERKSKGYHAAEPAPEEKGSSGSDNLFQAGSGRLKKLVNTLLYGAASRIERGTSVCVCCRGTGSMTCSECGGKGLSKASSRHTGARHKENEWIMSNKCRRCRGYGRYECNACDGLGKRFIAPLFDE